MPLSTDDKENVLKELVVALQDRDESYAFGAPRMATVLMADGTYRNKTIGAGIELLLDSTRLAKDGDVIFSFTPAELTDLFADPQYVSVEFRGSKIDEALPMFLEDLLIVVGNQRCDGLLDDTENSALMESETVPDVLNWLWKAEDRRAGKDLETEADALKNNPLFGMFG